MQDLLESEPATIHDLPISDAPAAAPAPVAHSRFIKFYLVNCFHCSEIFDALQSAWCDCLVSDHTLRCSKCGECFCTAPISYQTDFWTEAPQFMWERRDKEDKTEKEPGVNMTVQQIQRPLILVADDEKPILAAMQTAIRKLGFGIITAQDGEQALQLAQDYRPEILIADALMPRMEGAELSRSIKSSSELGTMRVILMTSHSSDDNEREMSLRGCRADMFLQKPISMKTLQSILRK